MGGRVAPTNSGSSPLPDVETLINFSRAQLRAARARGKRVVCVRLGNATLAMASHRLSPLQA
jgi:hypothetical protein